MLPASGYTTASANAVATAASTALPPRLRTSTPASLASGASDTTIARLATTGARPAGKGHAAGKRAGRRPAGGMYRAPEPSAPAAPASVAPRGVACETASRDATAMRSATSAARVAVMRTVPRRERSGSRSAAEPQPRDQPGARDAHARVVARRQPGLLVQRRPEVLHDVDVEVARERVAEPVREDEGEVGIGGRSDLQVGAALAKTGVDRRADGELEHRADVATGGDVHHAQRL